jgi:xanthine dehydrogenase iron-sulfur cluster and FAD-binding subunit A
VKPAPFAYAKARSLDHAIALLDGAPEARVLAGGQSLMPALNMRLSAPPLLVDINRVSELARIAQPNGQIELGGLVRHAQAEHSQDVARLAPLLSKAIPHIAHPAIRNRGTIGGSIALADPAAELPACLLALGGEIEIAGRAGRRTVAADTFFKGLFETALAPGEIISAIRIPVAQPRDRFGFAELARRHGDYAMVGLARECRCKAASRGGFATSRSCATERSMSDRVDIALTVNGEEVHAAVEPRQNLVDFLREELQLTGSHVGCEHGVCGACTVRVDGVIVRGCLLLAVQCEGCTVETIEGVSDTGEIADLQAAFVARNALQCGFCTPGMLLTAQELLLKASAAPSREEIRAHLSGNYCRCTGYQAIVDAVEEVALARKDGAR